MKQRVLGLLLPVLVVATPGMLAQGAAGPVGQPLTQQAQPQPAQTGNGTYTLQRTARLVVLDVVVTDAKGNAISGLTRDSFHVTEMDQPQQILNFDTAGARMPPPDATINSTADLDRIAPRAPVNIILLDEFNTRFEDMAFARYSLKKWLQKQPDKLTTPTMLIAVDLQHFTVLRDYTQDKEQILTALDHHFAAYPWQVHQYAWLAERYGTAFQTLMRVSQAVIGHPGHKNMIWIGRGFPPLNLANVPVDQADRVDNFVQQCVNALRDARVTLYSIDPAGVMTDPGVYGSAAAFNDPFGGNYQFSKLARATGGKALYGRNDVDAEIGTSIRDGASFYTLTYRPTTAGENPQKFRRIKVTVDQPGLTVTTREGYYLARGPGRVDPQNPSHRLVGDLLSAENSTMVYDGVPVQLTRSADNPNELAMFIDARGLSWSPATDTDPRRHAEVILMATTFDKKGKELNRIAKTIRAAAPPDVPPTGRIERALNVKFDIPPDPKAVRARVVIRVSATGRIGTQDVDLTHVPPPAPASTAVPAPATPSTTPPEAAPSGAPPTR